MARGGSKNMKGLINIEIKDSFNKKDDSQKSTEDVFNNTSTLNNIKDVLGTYSASLGSITSGHIDNGISIIKDKNQKGFWRDIIIGTVSAVLGATITYFIFGIK